VTIPSFRAWFINRIAILCTLWYSECVRDVRYAWTALGGITLICDTPNRTRPCQGCHFHWTVTTQVATYTYNFETRFFRICIPLLQSFTFMADKISSFFSLYVSFLHGSPVLYIITKFSRTSGLTLNELVPNRQTYNLSQFFSVFQNQHSTNRSFGIETAGRNPNPSRLS